MSITSTLRKAFINRWVLGGVILLDVGFYAPTILSWVVPPVKDFRVYTEQSYRYTRQSSVSKEEVIVIKGYLFKLRCRFLAVDGTVYMADGTTQDVNMDFRDRRDADQTANREYGPQDWGPWYVVATAPPEAVALQLYSTHRCGWGALNYTVVTELGSAILVKTIPQLAGNQ